MISHQGLGTDIYRGLVPKPSTYGEKCDCCVVWNAFLDLPVHPLLAKFSEEQILKRKLLLSMGH